MLEPLRNTMEQTAVLFELLGDAASFGVGKSVPFTVRLVLGRLNRRKGSARLENSIRIISGRMHSARREHSALVEGLRGLGYEERSAELHDSAADLDREPDVVA